MNLHPGVALAAMLSTFGCAVPGHSPIFGLGFGKKTRNHGPAIGTSRKETARRRAANKAAKRSKKINRK